jgi:hypothetical protein
MPVLTLPVTSLHIVAGSGFGGARCRLERISPAVISRLCTFLQKPSRDLFDPETPIGRKGLCLCFRSDQHFVAEGCMRRGDAEE